MPTTINGIGTHYYGRRNVQTRQATCRHCGRTGTLTSYDTRLWFVLIFVPIIPLKRKRIVDQCATCSWHYALELEKWESMRQLEISGALDKYRANPNPDTAIEAHQALVNFLQLEEAAEFRKRMKSIYADNARVHAYLGGVLEFLGQPGESTECFLRSLELRPDLPEARVGVAMAYIRSGRLDDARSLLEFLEKPGAAQLYSLGPLETLALGYQSAGRHEDALTLFQRLLEALPALGEHTGFRANVERSERALHRATSMMSRRKFSWKRFVQGDPTAPRRGGVGRREFAWIGLFLGLGVLAAVLSNEYIRRHRTLYVVNALPRSVLVEVRGAGSMTVSPGTAHLTLSEGAHHATIHREGGPAEEIDFLVRSGYWDRWFNDPVWLLNPAGAAVLMTTSVVYKRHDPPPPVTRFLFGHPFEFLPDVSHPFKQLPDSMRLKSSEQRMLTQLSTFSGRPVDLFGHLQKQGSASEAWRLAESQLMLHPDDDTLLRAYAVALRSDNLDLRLQAFLRRGLTNRPVRVEWHRAYHGLLRDRTSAAQQLASYDEQLRQEPDNSVLLYLRSRLTPDRAEARAFIARAAAADPRNPYPHFAQGYERCLSGDWAGARELFQKAVSLRPNDPGFGGSLLLTRFALGEQEAIAAECREALRRNPLDLAAVLTLSDALVSAGRTNEAPEVIANLEQASAPLGAAGRETVRFARLRLLYALGDFAGLEKLAEPDRSRPGRLALFQAQLEQGQMAEAVKTYEALGAAANGMYDLAIAVGWMLQGKVDEARAWRERAAKRLAEGELDDQRAAAVLRSPDPASDSDLNDLGLMPGAKAIVLVCLGQQHPSRRGDWFALARKLSVDPGFPHHLLIRATGP